MIVVIGLVILVAAVIAGVVGVLSNGGSGHALAPPFAVFGYHVTGSTVTLFLYGIVVGAVALFGLSVLLAGARRTSRRGRQARPGRKGAPPRAAAARQGRGGVAPPPAASPPPPPAPAPPGRPAATPPAPAPPAPPAPSARQGTARRAS